MRIVFQLQCIYNLYYLKFFTNGIDKIEPILLVRRFFFGYISIHSHPQYILVVVFNVFK